MYDSPDQRDKRIARLEQQAQRDHDALVKFAELVERLAGTLEAVDGAARKLTVAVGFIFQKLGVTDFSEFVQYAAKQSAPCQCAKCVAERAAKQQPSAAGSPGKPPETAGGGTSGGFCGDGGVDDALAGAIANAIAAVMLKATGEQFTATVTNVHGDDVEEYIERVKRDGERAAKEWLGMRQLERGAKGE